MGSLLFFVEVVSPGPLFDDQMAGSTRAMAMALKAYVVTTGLLFLALFAAHAARIVDEGPGPLSDQVFVITSVLALGMALWAVLILRRLEKR